VAVFLAGLVVGWALVGPLIELAARAGAVRANYRGDGVPTSGGVVFVLTTVFTLVPVLLVDGNPEVMGGLTIALGMGFVGFLDDAWGLEGAKGFRGHLAMLFRGRVSTGLLKALLGGLVSLAAVATCGFEGPELLARAAVVALSANALNQLDLRPGRAASVFALGASLIALAGFRSPVILSPLGAVLAYLPRDEAGEVMMGDTGANILGGLLGLALALFAGAGLYLILAGLVAFNLVADSMSLTKLLQALRSKRDFSDNGE